MIICSNCIYDAFLISQSEVIVMLVFVCLYVCVSVYVCVSAALYHVITKITWIQYDIIKPMSHHNCV